MSKPAEWDDSSCKGMNPDIFFERGLERRALRICSRCPRREECLEYAIENNEHYGIWGGMQEDERIRYRKSLQKRQRKERRLAS